MILLAVTALFLLPFPSGASSSDTTSAELSFTKASLDGNVTFDNIAYLVQALRGPGSFSWTLTASNITVNVTKQTYAETGSPTNLSEPYGKIATGPPQQSNVYFTDATANSTSRKWTSHVKSSTFGAIPRVVQGAAVFLLTPSRPGREADTLPENNPGKLPANATWATANNGVLVLAGDFSLEVWDAVVTLRNQTTERGFESGNWTEGIGAAPPGQPHPIRERHEQRVRLDLRDAGFEIRPMGRNVSFAAPRIVAAGNAAATFHDANGVLHNSGSDIPVNRAAWTLAGSMKLEVWNPVENGSLLQGLVTGSPETFGLPALPENVDKEPGSNIAAAKPLETPTWLWVPLGLIGLPWVALLAARRYAPGVTVDDVEWALLEHKPRYAARLARRFLRYHPNDGTGIFLLATALVVRKKHKATLRRVEPLALRIKKEDRGGTALLLAESAQRVGDTNKARRWAREAALDPRLLEEIRSNERLSVLLG